MKNILFVYDKFNTGGIETLILRTSTWLVNHGFNVSILMKKKGELNELLDSRVQVIELGRLYSYLYLPFMPNFLLDRFDFNSLDLVMSFHPRSNWIAANLINSLKVRCRYITGVYHPRAYYNNDLHLAEKISYKLLIKSLDKKSVLFMNEDCKRLHSENLKLSFENSFIWPLPVNQETFKNVVHEPKKYLIVSIGRLAPFKTYNMYMIDIVKQMVDNGYDVEYEIYGTGELLKPMKEKVLAYNLSNRIHLKGLVKYDKFSEVLKRAYLFVGMGTSAVEASFCKVPVIVAIENNKDGGTYGYLHELPYYNVGEENRKLQMQDVSKIVEKTLVMSDDEYHALCDKGYDYVQSYSLEVLMPLFIKYTGNLSNVPVRISRYIRFIYFVLELAHPLIKLLKRFFRKRKY